jgi:hypothetical protein
MGFQATSSASFVKLFAPNSPTTGHLRKRVEDLKKMFTVNPLVKQVIEFINCGSDRSFLSPNTSVSRGIESAVNDKAHELGWIETTRRGEPSKSSFKFHE